MASDAAAQRPPAQVPRATTAAGADRGRRPTRPARASARAIHLPNSLGRSQAHWRGARCGKQPRVLAFLILAGCAAAPAPTAAPHVTPSAATATTAHIPPFARGPYEPFSREAAVQIALGEWRAFRQPVVYPNVELPEDEEREEGLWQRVGLYWWLGLDPSWPQSGWTGIHDENGQVFPAGRDGFYAWSAAFISYVMRMAGAGAASPIRRPMPITSMRRPSISPALRSKPSGSRPMCRSAAI